MKSDSQIQNDVMQELKWDPSIEHQYIGVTAVGGIVTLSGTVPSYVQKSAAEKAAQRVAGVKAVVEKIEVLLPNSLRKGDQEVAKSIISQFEWNIQIPDNRIKVNVEDGWVELTGELDWDFQRIEAVRVVRATTGVKGVRNLMTLKAKKIQPSEVRQKIADALKRAAESDAKNIQVSIQGSEVTLTGNVSSYAEKEDARWAAFSSPGVTRVQNDLTVLNF